MENKLWDSCESLICLNKLYLQCKTVPASEYLINILLAKVRDCILLTSNWHDVTTTTIRTTTTSVHYLSQQSFSLKFILIIIVIAIIIVQFMLIFIIYKIVHTNNN